MVQLITATPRNKMDKEAEEENSLPARSRVCTRPRAFFTEVKSLHLNMESSGDAARAHLLRGTPQRTSRRAQHSCTNEWPAEAQSGARRHQKVEPKREKRGAGPKLRRGHVSIVYGSKLHGFSALLILERAFARAYQRKVPPRPPLLPRRLPDAAHLPESPMGPIIFHSA